MNTFLQQLLIVWNFEEGFNTSITGGSPFSPTSSLHHSPLP
jgi:hypothetical protein